MPPQFTARAFSRCKRSVGHGNLFFFILQKYAIFFAWQKQEPHFIGLHITGKLLTLHKGKNPGIKNNSYETN